MSWKYLCVALVCAGCAAAQKPQMAKDAHPVMEVATITPADPAKRQQGLNTDGQRVSIDNESITSMVMFAYGVHAKQIMNKPELMNRAYDIRGVSDTPGDPNTKQFQEMVRAVLVERFGLEVHHEMRTLPVYSMTVLKSGAKMPLSKDDPNAQSDQNGRGGPHGMEMLFSNNSMDEFALALQYFLDRPVVNDTKLPGNYTFTLQWKPGTPTVADPADYPDFFTAAQRELGLKFSPVSEPVDVLVIDAVTDPTEN